MEMFFFITNKHEAVFCNKTRCSVCNASLDFLEPKGKKLEFFLQREKKWRPRPSVSVNWTAGPKKNRKKARPGFILELEQGSLVDRSDGG
jgi:hypothetical protein